MGRQQGMFALKIGGRERNCSSFLAMSMDSFIKFQKLDEKLRGCPAGPVTGNVELPDKLSDCHGDRVSAYFVYCCH